jgi:hypothetical protein
LFDPGAAFRRACLCLVGGTMKRLISRPALGLVLLVLLTGFGCKEGKNVKLVPVRGKVMVGTETVAEGNVTLVPSSAGDEKGVLSAGQIKNGEYVIYSGGKEGAPEGNYKVTVTPPMMPTQGGGMPKTPFNSKYSDAKKTTLTLTVPSANYDLKLEK